MSDLVVFQRDLPDQSIERGMVGTIEGYDACLVRVRILRSGTRVAVLPSAISASPMPMTHRTPRSEIVHRRPG